MVRVATFQKKNPSLFHKNLQHGTEQIYKTIPVILQHHDKLKTTHPSSKQGRFLLFDMLKNIFSRQKKILDFPLSFPISLFTDFQKKWQP
jgi:hypothetical protein